MSDLKKYLEISFHSYEWGELTLTEQAELHGKARAELEAMTNELARLRDELRTERELKAIYRDQVNALAEAAEQARKALEPHYTPANSWTGVITAYNILAAALQQIKASTDAA